MMWGFKGKFKFKKLEPADRYSIFCTKDARAWHSGIAAPLAAAHICARQASS